MYFKIAIIATFDPNFSLTILINTKKIIFIAVEAKVRTLLNAEIHSQTTSDF